MRAHSWEQPEHDFGKAKARTAFGNNEIERQQRLEAAAQRLALHQPDSEHRQVECADVAIENFHTAPAIAHQAIAIAGPDHPGKKLEIATEAEYTGRTAAQN